jgi:hypothetical protein
MKPLQLHAHDGRLGPHLSPARKREDAGKAKRER